MCARFYNMTLKPPNYSQMNTPFENSKYNKSKSKNLSILEFRFDLLARTPYLFHMVTRLPQIMTQPVGTQLEVFLRILLATCNIETQ
jgi:hypothetical protein